MLIAAAALDITMGVPWAKGQTTIVGDIGPNGPNEFDHDFADFATSQPLDIKLLEFTEKWLLRSATERSRIRKDGFLDNNYFRSLKRQIAACSRYSIHFWTLLNAALWDRQLKALSITLGKAKGALANHCRGGIVISILSSDWRLTCLSR